MKILVTGAKGMVGVALCNNLKNIRDGKNKTRPNIKIDEIFEYAMKKSWILTAKNATSCLTLRA